MQARHCPDTSIYFIRQLSAQLQDSVKTDIDSAIYFMQTKSLFSDKVNWALTRDSAYYKAQTAKTHKEAFPALAYAFQQLGDHHGMIQIEEGSFRLPPPIDFDAVLSKGIKKEFLKGPGIAAKMLDNDIAYLRIPSMNVFSQADIDKRAGMLRDSLCYLLSKKPKALIIDLRMNTGGNSAPMISGLSPLFKNNILGYGVDKNGKFLAPTRIADGIALDENGNKLVHPLNDCAKKLTIPVAVLIGPSTLSSGEILAVFLKQQKNVKLFGEPISGFGNATEGFLFMQEQGFVLLAVNKIADAKKHIYKEMLVRPDIYVKSDDN